MTARPPCRREGSIYFPTLGMAMLVAVVGLTGLLLARVQTRSENRSAETAEAEALARSVLQVAAARLEADPGWRSSRPHDTWIAEPISTNAGVVCEWKLTDDDGSLADDANDPVMLTGRVTVGHAVRTARVTLSPVPTDPKVSPWPDTALAIEPGSFARVVD